MAYGDELTTMIAELTAEGLTCTDIKRVLDALVARFPSLTKCSGRKITKKGNIVMKESFNEERRVPSLRTMHSMRDLMAGKLLLFLF